MNLLIGQKEKESSIDHKKERQTRICNNYISHKSIENKAE